MRRFNYIKFKWNACTKIMQEIRMSNKNSHQTTKILLIVADVAQNSEIFHRSSKMSNSEMNFTTIRKKSQQKNELHHTLGSNSEI